MVTATKERPLTWSHAQYKKTPLDSWINKLKQCPGCLDIKHIETGFGTRKMHPKDESPVPQSYCRACRKAERDLRAKTPEIDRDEVIRLIRLHKNRSGYIDMPPEEKPAKKPAKQAKKTSDKPVKEPKQVKEPKPTKAASKVKTTKIENIATTDRLQMATLYDFHFPDAKFKGVKLAWKKLFKQLRGKLGNALVIDKAVFEFPDYLEILADEKELANSF